jgi:hypothetical protein
LRRLIKFFLNLVHTRASEWWGPISAAAMQNEADLNWA